MSRTLFILIALCTCSVLGASAADLSCSANSESRKLDFWLGNWTMTDPSANSKVSLSLDQCLFTEHWENGKGHVADKMFAYSPDDKSWYGMFTDNEGRVHVFSTGKVIADSAQFQGTSRGPKGETVLNRLSVVRLAPNKLEETWEKSSNNGTSWTTVYRADYLRANP